MASRIRQVAPFLAVIFVTFLGHGLSEFYFMRHELKATLVNIQREQAENVAAKIGQFVREVESHLGWTVQLPWSANAMIEQRRFDALRLLRQVPAVTELAQIDGSGRERLRESRLAMPKEQSVDLDVSKEPHFTEAVARKIYYGPVYFRREAEPYMTLALAGVRANTGVVVAELNLKYLWDVITAVSMGGRRLAYVVDSKGRLLAHPDLSLVLRNTDFSTLPQVQAALAEKPAAPEQISRDSRGREVLAATAPVPALGWNVFVELPVEEARRPLYEAAGRSGILLLVWLVLAFGACLLLARRAPAQPAAGP